MVRFCGFLFLACCVVFSVSGCVSSSGGAKKPVFADQEQLALLGTEISADCIVTYFDEQGSKYVSEQHHTIYPQAMSITVTAVEPEGDFQWSLLNGVFSTVSRGSSNSSVTLCSNEIAHSIVLNIAAKGGFLGDETGIMLDPVSIAGQVYQPIVLHSGENSLIKQKLYRDVSTNKINWVEVGNSGGNVLYASRGYNVRKIKDSVSFIPTSIDVYNTGKDGRPSDLKMKIEYKTYVISN